MAILVCLVHSPHLFLKNTCHVSAQNAEFPTAGLASKCLLSEIPKACILSCAVESAEHMFTSWSSLWYGAVQREQAELMTELVPGGGRKIPGLVQEPCPGRCWAAPCVLSALLCRFSLACVCSVTHSVLTVLTHRWPRFLYYTLGWRPCSSAKQQWNYQNRPVSDSSWHWRASVPLREEQG